MFDGCFTSLNIDQGVVVLEFVVVGVHDDDGVARFLRLMNIRQLGAKVDAVVDDETSKRRFKTFETEKRIMLTQIL